MKHTLTFLFQIPGEPIPLPVHQAGDKTSQFMRKHWSGNTVPIQATIDVKGNLTKERIAQARLDAETRFLEQVKSMQQAQTMAASPEAEFVTTAGEDNETTVD